MSKVGRVLVLLFVLFALVACDQGTKSIAQNHLSTTEPIILLNGMVRLQLMENPGAFLSLFANLPPHVRMLLLTVMNGLILGGVAVVLLFRSGWDKWSFTALGLLLAVGVGNLIDLVWLGGVVIDFMVIDLGRLTGIGWLKTGIFNVADIAITAGFLMLLPYLVRKEPQEPEPTAEAAA
ncbi:MAG: signal peptidase II [Caldilineaceae bacterium]|nr:signal peptidase II [Caldilineaceae bacterium]